MNELTLNEATQEIIKIHNEMIENQKKIKSGIRKYNSLVKREFKLLNNEAAMQLQYCLKLKSLNIPYYEQVVIPLGRIDVLT